jgi:hypothetical protein
VELSEAFCRRQQTLAHRSLIRRHAAPWQQAPRGDLNEFWTQMALRPRILNSSANASVRNPMSALVADSNVVNATLFVAQPGELWL